MHSEKKTTNKNRIILIVIILSIILYFTGVISGLYANKIIKEETKRDIGNLQVRTEQTLDSLQSYVTFLDNNLKDMQLEQVFIESLSPNDMCNFLNISLNELIRQLGYYWNKLPYRLEEYEKNNKLSEQYILLKEQYSHLSIRTWIIAKSEYDKCSMDVVHGLYFYSRDCEICVKQGEEIDKLNKKVLARGSEMIMFPIDFNSNQSIVKDLKKYYGINSTPAIIINDKVFQGRFFTVEEMLNYPTKTDKKK